MIDLPEEAIDRLASAAARMLSETGFELDDVDVEYLRLAISAELVEIEYEAMKLSHPNR